MQYSYSDRIKDIRPSAIREILKYAATHPGVIALSTGSPSDEAVPVEEIHEISEWIFKEMPLAGLQYSMTEGYPALRESTKKRLKEAFNIGKDFDDVIITTGGQQGLSLAPNVLCLSLIHIYCFYKIKKIQRPGKKACFPENRLCFGEDCQK